MSIGTKSLFRCAAVLAAAVALSGGFTHGASAEAVGASVSRGAVQSSDSRVGAFNWLAKPNAAVLVRYEPVAPRIARQIGNGSWICSPAGFGRKSRCYSN